MYVSSIQSVDGQEVIGTTEPVRIPEPESTTAIEETTEAVTDEVTATEPVTDENGEVVTAEPATDENGEIITTEPQTDENGEIIEAVTTEENSEE